MEPKEPLSFSRRNLLLLTVMMGTILVPINSTMISIGLTSMAQDLHVSIASIAWLVTIYLLIMASIQPLSGKLNDTWGRKRTFIAGASLFLVASVGCIASDQLLWLIVFRAIQAMGGAVMYPAATALIRVNTSDRGMTHAFGILSLVTGLGAAVGPLLGAALIGLGSWRWLFGVNVPVMLACIALAFVAVPESHGKRTRIDWGGSGLLLGVLLGGVLMLTGEVQVSVYAVIGWTLLVGWFALRQKKTEYPLIPFVFFRKVRFTVGNVSILLSNFVMYATILTLPIFLRQRQDMSLQEIGLLLLVFSISMSVCSWLGSAAATRVGKPALIGLGFGMNIVSSMFYWLILRVWMVQDAWIFSALLIFGGASAGVGIVSMQTMSLESVPREDAGSASGIYSTFRYVGSILSSVAVALFYHQVDVIFFAMASLSAIGALLIVVTQVIEQVGVRSSVVDDKA
ncbi:MFS transporter [Sulfoacidibacillus ferrooxidans]|nr:MFS transporter [Sulfoacidibacillus ferrooxidans]